MDRQPVLKNQRVLYKKKGRLAFVTLNRPDKLNALDIALMQEFSEVINIIRQDDDVAVVIVTGAGSSFSVGADFSVVHSLETPEGFRRDLKQVWHKSFDAIEDMEKLYIAALNGVALGGGLELALACDLRLAAEGVTVALPEIKYGLIPDAGGTNRLARLIGPARAKELILSGGSISCDDAYRWGLVNRILPADNFLDQAIKYAEKFLNNSMAAIGLGKLAVNRSLSQDTKSGLDDAMMIQSILLKSDAYLNAIRKLREKQNKK